MTLKIDMFIGPKMVDVRGQTDPQKTLPKGSRKRGPKRGGSNKLAQFQVSGGGSNKEVRSSLYLLPPPLGSEAELTPIRDGATHRLEFARNLCVLFPEQLDPRGDGRLGAAHLGAAGGRGREEQDNGVPIHGSLNG